MRVRERVRVCVPALEIVSEIDGDRVFEKTDTKMSISMSIFRAIFGNEGDLDYRDLDPRETGPFLILERTVVSNETVNPNISPFSFQVVRLKRGKCFNVSPECGLLSGVLL